MVAESRLREYRRHHYEVEKLFAQRILDSPKGSIERRRLFREGYSKVISIMEEYNPEAVETRYTDVVVSIVGTLVMKNGVILDVGCGWGNLVLSLLKEGYDAYGIDVSDSCITRAREKLKHLSKESHVQLADIATYQGSSSFDCIVMDNVIEHIHPDETIDVLCNCRRMLNSRGCLLILTPHVFSGPHDVSKMFLPLGSKPEGFHLREFSFRDLTSSLKEAGFEQVLGFLYDPRLLRKFRLIPKPSVFAARKAQFLESLFDTYLLSKLLKINQKISQSLVALLFPSVVIAMKGSQQDCFVNM